MRWRNGGKIAAVAALVFMWLGICALEVSPELHHLLHNDANNPAHNCLVTQLQHHSIISGAAPMLVPMAPVAWSPPLVRYDFQLLRSFDYRLSPSRAPPIA